MSPDNTTGAPRQAPELQGLRYWAAFGLAFGLTFHGAKLLARLPSIERLLAELNTAVAAHELAAQIALATTAAVVAAIGVAGAAHGRSRQEGVTAGVVIAAGLLLWQPGAAVLKGLTGIETGP